MSTRRTATALSKSQIREFEGNHLYVINTSDLNGSTSRTQLLMTFYINGNPQTIAIPSTWIPIDLTSLGVNIEAIKNNTDFWHFINKKALAVISTDVAEETLEEDDAQEEYDRIYDIKTNGKTDDEYEIHDLDDRMRQNRPALAKGNLKKEDVSAKVMAIVTKENLSEGQKLASLKNIQHEITMNDFRYILRNAKNGDQERLKQWASTKISNS